MLRILSNVHIPHFCNVVQGQLCLYFAVCRPHGADHRFFHQKGESRHIILCISSDNGAYPLHKNYIFLSENSQHRSFLSGTAPMISPII